MSRILLAAGLCAAVSIAALTAGPRPASAYGDAPWCAVMSLGWGDVATQCSYWSIEECLPYVLGGNRGFCERNPEFRGPLERSGRRYYRHRDRY